MSTKRDGNRLIDYFRTSENSLLICCHPLGLLVDFSLQRYTARGRVKTDRHTEMDEMVKLLKVRCRTAKP